MNKEKRKRLIPLSDWVPKIMKYFSKSNRPATSRTQKKRKKSEIMNRKGIVESKWKTRGNHEGQSGEDQSLTLQVVLSIKVFSVRKMEVVEAQEDIKGSQIH